MSMTLSVTEFQALSVAEKMDYLYEKLRPLLEKQESAGFWKANRKAVSNGR